MVQKSSRLSNALFIIGIVLAIVTILSFLGVIWFACVTAGTYDLLYVVLATIISDFVLGLLSFFAFLASNDMRPEDRR